MLGLSRRLAIAAALSGACGVLPACAIEEGPPPVTAEGYQPQYYDGYVVYYDGAGRPFYYVNGGIYWVPTTSPFYVGLVDHWRVHRPEYDRWYAHSGGRYRGYRRR